MSKQAAFGTRLRYTANSGLTSVHHVADITGPSVSRETIDVTDHESPDGFREYLPGIGDGGELVFDLFFDPDTDGHADIEQLAADGTPVVFQMLLPRLDDQLLDEPAFDSLGAWQLGGEWVIAGGQAHVLVVDPDGDVLSQNVTGLDNTEIYQLAVDVAEPGEGVVTISFDGNVIGVLSLAAIGIQRFEFTPVGSEGDLELTVTSGPANVRLASVSLFAVGSPDSGRFDFSGIFTKADNTFPYQDALRANITIKVTGKPEYTSF